MEMLSSVGGEMSTDLLLSLGMFAIYQLRHHLCMTAQSEVARIISQE